jgi:VCBS repeat-containing protein
MFTLHSSDPYGLTSVGQEIFAGYSGGSNGLIEVYSRSGTLLRSFNSATIPAAFSLGGASTIDTAQRANLAIGQNATSLDFGSTGPADALPVAVADSFTATEDVPLNIPAAGVLANDTDADSPTLTSVVETAPAHGTLTLNADGSFLYTPASNYNGPDSFTYRASDGQSTGNVATVSLTVTPVNDAPSFVVGADRFVDDESGDRQITHWASLVTAGPTDEASQSLTFVCTADRPDLLAEQPRIDFVLGSWGQLTYTLAPNKTGVVNVTVVLKDDGGTAHGGVDVSPPQTFAINIAKAHPRHNAVNRLDVDPNGRVEPGDALEVINFLNAFGPKEVALLTGSPTPYYDVTGDGNITPGDALDIINYLNAFPPRAGEGEGEPADAALWPLRPSVDSSMSDLLILLAYDQVAEAKRRP